MGWRGDAGWEAAVTFKQVAACNLCDYEGTASRIHGINLDLERLVKPSESQIHICKHCVAKLKRIVRDTEEK